MQFQRLSDDVFKQMNQESIQYNVNSLKSEKATQEIMNLERVWNGWMSQQQINEETIKKNEEGECTEQTDEKGQQLRKFFENLRQNLLEQKLFSTLTQTQITQFFEEATTQIQNKIKLYEDIQKLKLLSNYPSNTKRTYSKQANMILKRWLIENYSNPYPKPHQVEQLVQQTNLTNKQVLNWFINARNSLKNKAQSEKKFKHIVEQKFKELALIKKKKNDQSI